MPIVGCVQHYTRHTPNFASCSLPEPNTLGLLQGRDFSLLTLFHWQHRHKKIFFSPIRALWLFPVYMFSYYVELKSKTANPRLALLSNDVSLFSSLFDCSCCFLPQKCSQFCSLEHNYSEYLFPTSSTPRLLDFPKESLCSWRWLKHNLNKVVKNSILAGKCKRRRGPKYLAGPPSLYDAQFLKTSRAFFMAQPTFKLEGHLTPRHAGVNHLHLILSERSSRFSSALPYTIWMSALHFFSKLEPLSMK